MGPTPLCTETVETVGVGPFQFPFCPLLVHPTDSNSFRNLGPELALSFRSVSSKMLKRVGINQAVPLNGNTEPGVGIEG